MKPARMTATELMECINILFPDEERGRQRRLAEVVGRTEVSVSRWVHGITPIGRTETILIRLLVDLKLKKRKKAKLGDLI